MARVYNFSAGPAVLPEAVLQRIRADIPDWQDSGMSVMEVSHRSKAFIAVAEKAEADLRTLLTIGEEYSVLFLQGGASLQFAMTALNLAGRDDTADYVQTGSWSKKAINEAAIHCNVRVVASSEDSGHNHVPPQAEWQTSDDAAYLHYTPNETIGGVEFHFVPSIGDVPLVADMSSTILSRPIDVGRYGLIYAGAQKNIGPAGITVVIVRNDLLEPARSGLPTLLTYKAFAESGSMINTPPTFAWYVAGLVFEHLLANGGLEEMVRINQRKATKLYAAIDESGFYKNPVRADARSWMNVPFVLADSALDGEFLAQAESAGLTNLKGHRSVGGMRASIYNAMPESGVDALIELMRDFEKNRA